jgi:F-type H+-transporting ATPase subunit b
MIHGWFTIVAQVVNFLILVWLLKRFLYKPILHAIDEREKSIATQLADAQAKEAEARRERDEFQHKNDAFDQERIALLKKATEEAKAEHRRLLEEARKDADALRAKRQEALRVEQRNLRQEIIRRTQKEVFAIARKTLGDLATTSLEVHMGEIFVSRLRALTGPAKEQLAAALKSSKQSARVRSAFDLPPAQRSAIEIAVREICAVEAPLQFESAPELVSGIELSTEGQKVAWSITDYLATLEKSAGDFLLEDAKPASEEDAKSKPETKADDKPGPNNEPRHGLEPVASAPKAGQ